MENQEQPKVESKTSEVKPLRDFTIKHNEHFIELKKGEKIDVPKKFLQNLKTEKVIK